MKRRNYYMYIMASRSGTLYTGVTNSLDKRTAQHREGLNPGFTKKYRIHRLVYFEEFQDVRSAISREKQIKGWLRSKKIALIESLNPTWEDLSADWGKPIEIPDSAQKSRSFAALRMTF